MRHDRGLEASPRCAIYWKWKEGNTKVDLDDAKAALSELETDDLVVQAKAPAGANSSTTSGFAARMLNAKIPPTPYYHDADGDEPSGWVSRGGPDNSPEASNADQTDTDADGIGDACEAPVVSDPVLTDPALTGASV